MNEIKGHAKKWIYWFLLGIAIICVYKILDNFGNVMQGVGDFLDILTPFFIGILIAYLLYIPCKKVESFYRKSKNKLVRKKSRSISILTVYIFAALLLIILLNVILPVVIESVVDLANNIQGYYEMAMQKYKELPEDSFLKGEQVNNIVNEIQKVDLRQFFKLDNVLQYAKNAIGAVTGIINIFVALIVSVYILSQRTQILSFIKRLLNAMFKERIYKNIDKIFNNSNEIFFKFIASQFIDAVIIGVLVTIAMSIMGVKYAPLLGFLIGLFNMIPYVGAIIAVIISALITLITGGLTQMIWMLIVVTILQQVDANIINPKIVGQSLKISPLLVLFAITVGGAYFGILGMFLAVPVSAVILIVIEDYIKYRLIKKENQKEELIEENKIKGQIEIK